ncbi:MAG: LysE family transporter [Micrococcus sp.]|nr:LysE family transporter [Micrococcus sp.]
MTIFATGFLTYLALIVAIGAQTLFLLRQIVRGDRVWLSLSICAVADLVLLAAGVLGIGVMTERFPWLITVLTVGGVAYLVWFASTALRSAWRGDRALDARQVGADDVAAAVTDDPSGLDALGTQAEAREHTEPVTGVVPVVGGGGVALAAPAVQRVHLVRPQSSVAKIWALALSVSLLNPHAILDAVVMMGTIAHTYTEGMWIFTAGAALASIVWFLVLGWGGTKLAPWLSTPKMWRIVDTVVGLLMLGIAAKVALSLF